MRRSRADLEPATEPPAAGTARAAAEAPRPAPERVPPGELPVWRGWVWLVAAGISLALLGLLAPAELLRATTPAGFDMSGQVYPIWRAVTHTLPAGRLHGWDTGWFGGFPFYFFYFPLCALLVAVLAPLTGFLVAFKLVSVLGVLALPFAVLWLLRELRLSERAAVVALPVALTFSVATFNELGGNIASTLAGEFSYGLSFSLSIAYLAALRRAERSGARRGGVLPGILLGLAALSHVVTVFMVVLVTVPGLLRKATRPAVLVSWLIGIAVSAWWAVPFVLRLPYSFGVPVPQPLAALAPLYLVPLMPLAVLGVLQARKRGELPWPVLGLGALALVMFLLPEELENTGRLLPYWYFAVCLLAGLAAGWSLEQARAGKARMLYAVTGLAYIPLLAAVPALSEYRTWAAWDYSGLEAKPAWRDVAPLVAALDRTPPGRVYWEYDWPVLARLGSVHIFSLLPYWSPAHPALRGLWQQSSPLTPAVDRLDAQIRRAALTADSTLGRERWQAAVGELGRLGVAYFIALRPASPRALARVAGVRALASAGPLVLFALPAPRLVRRADGGEVDRVAISENEIRFHTSAPGQPHTVAVTFFPGWRAAEGAGQPRRGADRLLEVVPTGPDVRLVYRTGWPERLGAGLSVLGLVGAVAGLALRAARGRRRPGSVVEASAAP